MRHKTERNTKIVEMYKSGNFTQRKLGKLFGLSKPRVFEILHRRRGKATRQPTID